MASGASAWSALRTQRGPTRVLPRSTRPAVEALPSHSCRISAGQPARLRKSTYHLPWVGTSESCCSAPRSRGKAVTAAATGGATNLDSTEGRQTADAESDPGDARAVVEAFYGAINRRDLESALTFISDDCVYEDLIYPQPFTGKQAVRQHFERVLAAIPASLAFSIDDITGDVTGGTGTSQGAPLTVGLTWHVELNGQAMPFSRGCSFYRCTRSTPDAPLQIIYARDIPEPAVKPGNLSLNLLSAATFLLSRLPNLR